MTQCKTRVLCDGDLLILNWYNNGIIWSLIENLWTSWKMKPFDQYENGFILYLESFVVLPKRLEGIVRMMILDFGGFVSVEIEVVEVVVVE